jgi:hypothetical protein
MRRALLLVGIAAVSSVLTAAAIVLPASASGDASPSDDRIEAFESCMRESGFDFGPETIVEVTRDGVRINGNEVDADDFRAAKRECGPLFRGDRPRVDGVLPPELDERLERLRDCVESEEA